jgi:hypothetical protein
VLFVTQQQFFSLSRNMFVQNSIARVMGAIFLRVKGLGYEAGLPHPLCAMANNGGAVPPLLH